MAEKDLKCHCGKLLGKVKNGKLYLYCKQCKKEVQIDVIFEPVQKENTKSH